MAVIESREEYQCCVSKTEGQTVYRSQCVPQILGNNCRRRCRQKKNTDTMIIDNGTVHLMFSVQFSIFYHATCSGLNWVRGRHGNTTSICQSEGDEVRQILN